MDKPIPVQLQSPKEIKIFLQGIANLPDETILEILYRLDYQRLMAICKTLQELPETEWEKYGWLSHFCDDVNFWRDWLIEHGYDLPETLPQTLQVFKHKGQSDFDVLKRIFFEGSAELRQIKQEMMLLLSKRVLHQGPRGTKIEPEEMDQAVLDLDYLDKQVKDRILRKEGKPRVFIVDLFMTQKQYNNLPDLPDNTSAEDLIQLFVDHDLTWLHNFVHRDIFSDWARAYFTPERLAPGNLTYAAGLRKQLEEQDLATLPFFLQEGDLVILRYLDIDMLAATEYMKYGLEFYYVGPKEKLYKVSHPNEDEEIFFPEVALSFLRKHSVTTEAQLKELYPKLFRVDDLGYLGPFGYIENGEEIEFPEN